MAVAHYKILIHVFIKQSKFHPFVVIVASDCASDLQQLPSYLQLLYSKDQNIILQIK